MKWTPEKVALLRATYPTQDTHDVAASLGCSARQAMVKANTLGIRKAPGAKRVWTAHTKLPSTWGFGGHQAEQASRGRTSAWRRKPLGSEFVSRGDVFVKVAETGVPSTDWRRKSRVEWEKHHGRALGPQELIRFADGNRRNFHPDNLVLYTQADNITENSIHALPPVIADLYRAKGQIVRAARRRK